MMQRENSAVCSACIGGGMGMAMIAERTAKRAEAHNSRPPRSEKAGGLCHTSSQYLSRLTVADGVETFPSPLPAADYHIHQFVGDDGNQPRPDQGRSNSPGWLILGAGQ
jgi:hypothetical protein